MDFVRCNACQRVFLDERCLWIHISKEHTEKINVNDLHWSFNSFEHVAPKKRKWRTTGNEATSNTIANDNWNNSSDQSDIQEHDWEAEQEEEEDGEEEEEDATEQEEEEEEEEEDDKGKENDEEENDMEEEVEDLAAKRSHEKINWTLLLYPGYILATCACKTFSMAYFMLC